MKRNDFKLEVHKKKSSTETRLESHPADLNRRPADYESAALPTELEWHSDKFRTIMLNVKGRK